MDLVQQMRNSRASSAVLLQEYVSLRSRFNGLCFIVEGQDDLIFYASIFKRFFSQGHYKPLIAKGKKQLLAFKKVLSENVEFKNDWSVHDQTYFFIDRDFDSQVIEDNLYCTPSYSFENLLVSKKSLESLLQNHYLCIDEFGLDDIDNVMSFYDVKLAEFLKLVKPINLLLYSSTKHQINLNGMPQSLKKNFIEFSFSTALKSKFNSLDELAQILGFPLDKLNIVKDDECLFNELQPVEMRWRGKFLKEFFINFLEFVKKDRNSISPMLFAKQKSVKFEPSQNTLNILCLEALIPNCMATFFNQMKNKVMRFNSVKCR